MAGRLGMHFLNTQGTIRAGKRPSAGAIKSPKRGISVQARRALSPNAIKPLGAAAQRLFQTATHYKVISLRNGIRILMQRPGSSPFILFRMRRYEGTVYVYPPLKESQRPATKQEEAFYVSVMEKYEGK